MDIGLTVFITEKVLREHRLPLEVLSPCLDVLLRANPQSNRKEFVSRVARAASDLRELASQTPEDQERLEMVEGRCLKMFIFMLREVNKVRVWHPAPSVACARRMNIGY